MLSGIGPGTSIAHLAVAYRVNDNFLNQAAQRLVSGKKFQQPKDNIPDYFRSQGIDRENRDYQRIQQKIGEGTAFMDVVLASANNVYQQLDNMYTMVKGYWNPDSTDDDRMAYKAEFDAAAVALEKTVDAATYDGSKVIQATGGTPLRSITLNPQNPTNTLDLEFNNSDIVDTAALKALDITGPDRDTVMNAFETEAIKSAQYLAKAKSYRDALQTHYRLNDTQMTTNENFQSVINGTREADEYVEFSKRSILQQTTVAMMAQANVATRSVLGLFQKN
jgi:flagellin